MGHKIGGGDHLQYYDENDGQYADEDKAKILEKDKENLVLYHLFDMHYEHIVFHFPVYGIHDKEYCEMFVSAFRNRIKKMSFDIRKAEYLLTPRDKDDKSKFLGMAGYSMNDKEKLIEDIKNATHISQLEYLDITKYALKCKQTIEVNGRQALIVWKLTKDLEINFVTLIPYGGK